MLISVIYYKNSNYSKQLKALCFVLLVQHFNQLSTYFKNTNIYLAKEDDNLIAKEEKINQTLIEYQSNSH